MCQIGANCRNNRSIQVELSAIKSSKMTFILTIPVLLLPLFLPMVLGYFFRKIKVFDERGGQALQTFVVKVSVPFLIFKNLYEADMRSLGQFFPLVTAYFLLTVLFTLAAYLGSPRVSADFPKQNAFGFSLIMGNYAFLGWSVVYMFYGNGALTRAVLFTLMFWPIFLSCGFWLVHRRSSAGGDSFLTSLKPLFKNAAVPVLSSAVGVGMNVLKIPVPEIPWKLVQQFAAITIPMILFTIGLNIKIRMPRTHLKVIAAAAFVRLILGFVFAVLVVILLKLIFPAHMFDTLSQKVILLEGPMPAAAMAVFFISYIKIDKEVMSGIIAFSTLASLLSIPLWYAVVEGFFA